MNLVGLNKLADNIRKAQQLPDIRQLRALLSDLLPKRSERSQRALLLQIAEAGVVEELYRFPVGVSVGIIDTVRMIEIVTDAYPTPPSQVVWGLKAWAEVLGKTLELPAGLDLEEPANDSSTDQKSPQGDTPSSENPAQNSDIQEEPWHWTELLPPEYKRLRQLHCRMIEGVRLPYSNNYFAAIAQFFWLLSHGLVGLGVISGAAFLSVWVWVIWHPELLFFGAAYTFLIGCLLFLFSDYLVFRRVENQVAVAGGVGKVSQDAIETWIKPRHHGWMLGVIFILLLIGAGMYRTFQIEKARIDLANAIQSTETLRLNIEEYAQRERQQGRSPNLPSYFNSVTDYQSIRNEYAVIKPEMDSIVLTLKGSTIVEGKAVIRRPYFRDDGRVDWYCWGVEIPDYVMPADCNARP